MPACVSERLWFDGSLQLATSAGPRARYLLLSMGHAIAILLFLFQLVCTSVASRFNDGLLRLDAHMKLQQRNAEGMAEPPPIRTRMPQSFALAAHYAGQGHNTSAGRNLAEVPASSSPSAPPATSQASATAAAAADEQLIDEPNLHVAPGNISVTSDPTAKPRPFKAAFFDELESWRTTASRDYVMGKLMPAAAALLARSIRVRLSSPSRRAA